MKIHTKLPHKIIYFRGNWTAFFFLLLRLLKIKKNLKARYTVTIKSLIYYTGYNLQFISRKIVRTTFVWVLGKKETCRF